MITKITTMNLRGHSLTVDLDKFTVIGGAHGSGKTSLVMGAHLALLGYVPGDDKRAADIMANCSGDELGVAILIDGHSIGRRWARSASGTVSGTVKVDGEKAAGKGADGMIRLALGGAPRLFDGFEFWNLSDRETRKAILRLTAGEKAEELLDLDAKPREALNRARADRQAAEKALQQATASLSTMPQTSGEAAGLAVKMQADRKALDELRVRIAAGDQADEERTRLLRMIEGKPAAEEERDRLRAQVKDSQREKPKEYATAGIVDAVTKALKTLETLHEGAGYLMWVLEQCEAAAAWPEQEKIQMGLQKAIGILEQKVRDANAAAMRLKGLPESPSAADKTALKGLQARVDEAAQQIESATRRAQVSKMVAQAQAQAEKCAEAEEAAKVKLAEAGKTMSQALTEGLAALATRAAFLLPEGALTVNNTAEKCELCWHRDKTGYVPRRALSGSERVVFDAAIAGALLGDGCTAVLDAGECGNDALVKLAILSERCPFQVVICRWTDSKIRLPKMPGWKVVELSCSARKEI